MTNSLELWIAIIASAFGKAPLPKNAEKAVAVVESRVQDVRVRRARTTLWVSLKASDELFVGDRIFVGDQSSAVVRYINATDTTLSMPTWSFLQIERDPLSASQQLRGIQPANSKKVQAEDKSSYAGLMLQRKVETLKILQPRREAFVQTQKKNAEFEIRVALPEQDRNEKLYGELWLTAPFRQPMWSGFADVSSACNCYSFPLVLPMIGSYSFVASNAQSTLATALVPITVEKVSNSILPSVLKPRDLVLVP